MYKSQVSKFQNNKRKMILEGNLLKIIIILILPIVCINIVFNILPKYIDMIFLDFTKDNNEKLDDFFYISEFVKFLNLFGVTIAMTGIILIGYELGKKDIEKVSLFVKTTIITVVTICLFITIFSSIIGYFCITKDLYIYFLTLLISGVFVSINTVFLGIARTDSKLKIIYLSNIIFIMAKFFFNFLFFKYFSFSEIVFLGLSSFLANIISFLFIFLFFLKKYNQKIKLINSNNQQFLTSNFFYFKSLIKMFIPLLLSRIIPESSRIILMFFIKKGLYSKSTITMIHCADNVVALGLQFGFALAEGQMLIIAENLGNRNIKRALKTIWIVLIINFVLGFIFTILIYRYGFSFLSFLQRLTNKTLDESNFEADKFLDLSWYACISGFFFTTTQGVLLKSMVAFKKPRIDMYFGFIKSFVLRIPLILFFKYFPPFDYFKDDESWKGFGLANLLTNIIVLFFIIFYFYFGFYQKLKKNNFKAI